MRFKLTRWNKLSLDEAVFTSDEILSDYPEVVVLVKRRYKLARVFALGAGNYVIVSARIIAEYRRKDFVIILKPLEMMTYSEAIMTMVLNGDPLHTPCVDETPRDIIAEAVKMVRMQNKEMSHRAVRYLLLKKYDVFSLINGKAIQGYDKHIVKMKFII